MCIGTFFIVYRVYYQHRRVFRSRRSNQNNSLGAVPNRAKSLFYLLFTLNLLYFILVSPVVFVTTILFQDPTAELAYPRFKALIYLMQYCNHSLNFIFYGLFFCSLLSALHPFSPRDHFSALPSNAVRMVRAVVSPFAPLLSTNDREAFENRSSARRPASPASARRGETARAPTGIDQSCSSSIVISFVSMSS